MAHDDEKPDSGDDPWAGLDADSLPDLEGDFSFSFDDEPAAETSAEGASPDADAAEPAVERAGDAIDDAAIDDWLIDGAAASSILPFEAPDHAAFDGGDPVDAPAEASMVEIGTGTSGIASPSSIEAGDDAAAEEAVSAVDGDPFAALSAAEAAGAADEMFAFAAQAAAADEFIEEHGREAGNAEEGGTEALGAFAAVGAAAASQMLPSADAQPEAGAKRKPAPRRKQPSLVGQLVGVVFGGAVAIPITLAILLWGLGKDPFGLAPRVPESLAFLLPPKFRPGAAFGTDAIDLAAAPNLDAVVSEAGAGDAGATDLPGAADLGDGVPAGDPEPPPEPEPLADAPAATALAAVAPASAAGQADPGDDPLMDLLEEDRAAAPAGSVAIPPPAPAVEPQPAPEPEPLDLTELDAAVAAATAALEAAAAVGDPADPVRRRLLAKWYRELAGYADRLAVLESLAAETGRPFEPAAARAEALLGSLADHPQLVEELGMLSRDWIAYAKRSSDGLVMPATFVAARRVGPHWRSQVSLPATDTRPAHDLVVLTRTEPAVAPGDAVMVTGLVVDDDVVWAVEVRPVAVEAGGAFGL